jgi:UDP-N-acetylmuramoylalanine--D-glutamate ligase
MMKKLLEPLLSEGRLLILGFGKEGQSTFNYIRRHFSDVPVAVADQDADLAEKAAETLKGQNIKLHLGNDYLSSLQDYRLIIKSPGVGLPSILSISEDTLITSQTRLMLQAYHRQITGVTGTKGKSTTSSLIHHLLVSSGIDSVLVGNIGLPPFDYLDRIGPDTRIVFEMSSHQLEDSILAPHIAVLLNLYPEHLDRYPSLEAYYNAKMRILTGQPDQDIFIYNDDIPEITRRVSELNLNRKYFSFSSLSDQVDGCYLSDDRIILSKEGNKTEYVRITEDFPLKGVHNRMNMMAAILAARNAGADDEAIRAGLKTFKTLEHRLEYVGMFKGIHFYNDSIATIPEAAIAAVKALPETDTIILGGFDRGLDYSALIEFLIHCQVTNFIFTGKAGARLLEGFKAAGRNDKKIFWADTLQDAGVIAFQATSEGKICLLSPAAASYDQFRNFEERGKVFKKIARGE